MFVLDTNVLSELRRIPSGRAEPRVVRWVKTNTTAPELFLSSMTILEVERGVLLLERRDTKQAAVLRRWLQEKVLVEFADRILPVDAVVARRCAALHVPRTRPERDALIAATALVHGMTVVTRNLADFADMGVALVNPWDGVRGSALA